MGHRSGLALGAALVVATLFGTAAFAKPQQDSRVIDRTFLCTPVALGQRLRDVDIDAVPSGAKEAYSPDQPRSPGFMGVGTGSYAAASELGFDPLPSMVAIRNQYRVFPASGSAPSAAHLRRPQWPCREGSAGSRDSVGRTRHLSRSRRCPDPCAGDLAVASWLAVRPIAEWDPPLSAHTAMWARANLRCGVHVQLDPLPTAKSMQKARPVFGMHPTQ